MKWETGRWAHVRHPLGDCHNLLEHNRLDIYPSGLRGFPYLQSLRNFFPPDTVVVIGHEFMR